MKHLEKIDMMHVGAIVFLVGLVFAFTQDLWTGIGMIVGGAALMTRAYFRKRTPHA